MSQPISCAANSHHVPPQRRKDNSVESRSQKKKTTPLAENVANFFSNNNNSQSQFHIYSSPIKIPIRKLVLRNKLFPAGLKFACRHRQIHTDRDRQIHTDRERHTHVHLCGGSWPHTSTAHTSRKYYENNKQCVVQEFAVAITIPNMTGYPRPQIRIRMLEIKSEIIMFRFGIFSARGYSNPVDDFDVCSSWITNVSHWRTPVVKSGLSVLVIRLTVQLNVIHFTFRTQRNVAHELAFTMLIPWRLTVSARLDLSSKLTPPAVKQMVCCSQTSPAFFVFFSLRLD